MTTGWTPPDEFARAYGRYKQARETERKLKPTIREMAVAALKAGATPAQLAELSGDSPEVFRRIRDANDIPVDPRYESRAQLARARKAAKPNPPGA